MSIPTFTVHIDPELPKSAVTALVQAGERPEDFASVELIPMQIGVNLAQEPQSGRRFVVFQVAAMLPDDVVDIPVPGILAADGTAMINDGLQRAIGVAPPTVRAVVRRTALKPEALARVEAFENMTPTSSVDRLINRVILPPMPE